MQENIEKTKQQFAVLKGSNLSNTLKKVTTSTLVTSRESRYSIYYAEEDLIDWLKCLSHLVYLKIDVNLNIGLLGLRMEFLNNVNDTLGTLHCETFVLSY